MKTTGFGSSKKGDASGEVYDPSAVAQRKADYEAHVVSYLRYGFWNNVNLYLQPQSFLHFSKTNNASAMSKWSLVLPRMKDASKYFWSFTFFVPDNSIITTMIQSIHVSQLLVFTNPN